MSDALPKYPYEDMLLTLHMRRFYNDQLWYHKVLEYEGRINEAHERYAECNGVSVAVAAAHYYDQVRAEDKKVEEAKRAWGT